MNEKNIQLLWRNVLFHQSDLKTRCGKTLRIYSPGHQNFNAGPDFFNARIRIDNMEWAGNVEVHKRSSDWVKHGHHLDAAYNNVILHIVEEDDSTTFSRSGRRIPVLQLTDPGTRLSGFSSHVNDELWINCQKYISKVSPILVRSWLTRLQSQRLLDKTRVISQTFARRGSNWEHTLFDALASSFGLPINSLPFEMTFGRIPFELLIRNRDNLLCLEAIIFGQAGFLGNGHDQGPYERELRNCHRSFYRELSDQPVDFHLWKFLRIRPASFPTLRISQYAHLLHKRHPMLDSILNCENLYEAEQLLKASASTYWDNHYLFGRHSAESKKITGPQSLQSFIINGLVPFLFTFGRKTKHQGAIFLANNFLQECEAESNHIIKKWAAFGIRPEGAFESQALIQLYHKYCKQKRCYDCQIGAELLRCDIKHKGSLP